MSTNDDEVVRVPRTVWDAVLAEQAQLRRRLEALEGGAAPGANAGRPAAEPAEIGRQEVGPVGRRAAVAGLLGAAVGGVAASLGSATPAAAATGDELVLGAVNTTNARTTLDAKGSDFGLYVKNNGLGRGIRAETTGESALYGYSNGTNVNKATAHMENGLDGLALTVSSEGPQFRLLSSESRTPITHPEYSYIGTMRASSDGELWFCTDYGTPGTWRKLAGRTTAGSLHVLPTPARIYDSRPGTAPAVGSKTKLTSTPRTLDLKANGSGVPAGATAALLTVLLVEATAGAGNLTVWAAGAAAPLANTLVWGGSAGRFTTSATTALDAQARCQIVASQPTHVVVDVVGYYR